MTRQSSRSRPRFLFLLATAHQRVQQHIRARDGGAGATRAGLLMVVGDDPTGMPLGAIGAALELGASSLSGLVDRMERDGLVCRAADPGDGRACRLHLTAAGRAARAEATARVRLLNDRVCAGFDDDELAVVARWLEEVRTNFPRENER